MKCMCAQTRPRFILSFERVFGGMEFEPMLTPREKSPLLENFPRGGLNPRRCGQRAQTLPTSYSGPLTWCSVLITLFSGWCYLVCYGLFSGWCYLVFNTCSLLFRLVLPGVQYLSITVSFQVGVNWCSILVYYCLFTRTWLMLPGVQYLFITVSFQVPQHGSQER